MFAEEENIVFALKWLSIVAKNGKKSLFYKEKSLVGLTPVGHKSSVLRFMQDKNIRGSTKSLL